MGTGADVALESADQIRGGKSGGIFDPVVGHGDDPRLRARPLDQLGLLLRQHLGLELRCESVAAAMRAAVALSPVSMTMRRDACGRDRSERFSLELIGEQRQRLAVTADERRGRSLRLSPRTAMSTPATTLRRFLRPLTGSTPRANAWLCCGPASAAGKAYGNALALIRAQRADADPAQMAPPKLSRSRHHGRVQSLVQASGILTVACKSGFVVSDRPLAGRMILVIEDEPLIALEMDKALRVAGAKVVSAGFLESGLCSTEHPELSAAVVDLQLGDGNGTVLCRRLRQLGVPFVVHTGYPRMVTEPEWSGATVICKPAHPDRIVSALVQLLAEDVARR